MIGGLETKRHNFKSKYLRAKNVQQRQQCGVRLGFHLGKESSQCLGESDRNEAEEHKGAETCY